MKKAVVSLSGGLDSLTCMATAHDQGYQVLPINFDYGQKNIVEREAAKAIAKHFDAELVTIDLTGLGALGGSAMTDDAIAVPDYQASQEIPVTYVPARNTIFLSIALGYAEIQGAEKIFLGANAIDYSGYPDCRPEYLAAYQKMADLATKAGVEGHGPQIVAPLVHMTKAEVIQTGHALGVDYGMSVSCYRANKRGEACSTCDSCTYRKKGFAEAGLPDPTRYAEAG